jgi:hypothetical protein
MPITAIVLCCVFAGGISLLFYALHAGYNVKAVIKAPFVNFTFEAEDKDSKKAAETKLPNRTSGDLAGTEAGAASMRVQVPAGSSPRQ